MAKITLGIIGDTTDVYSKISKLQADVAKIKPLQIKFEATGDTKALNAMASYTNAAARLQEAMDAVRLAEEKTKQANLAYAKQAEATRTAEQNRMKATQQAAAALSRKEQQEEKSVTATRQYAIQAEKTRTVEQQRLLATEKSKRAVKEFGDEQEKTATKTINFGNAFTKVWSRIVSTLSRRLINQAFTALRSNIQETLTTMKSVDTQLINIQKVSGKTSQEIAAIGERAYDTAAKYGVAVDDYLSAVYSFQKAGLGESAEELAELATKTMLVGDTTSAIAEKFLISSNAAWELHGNIAELNKVIDEADYINNNYATTLDKIAAGLPIVASVAANAGMSYSETMAALGTIQSITQESGTKSATALRALILNIEKEAGTYLSEDGEEFEVTEESIKGLQGLLEKYAKAEMDAARASGELINPMTAIKALFEGMRNEDLNENELFQLLSAMGGKLRTNQLTALVRNFDMFDQMLVQLGDSAGTADKEVELMLGSWEKKTQILKDRWTQFIAGLVSTDEIKGLIDDLTEFVTNLDPEQIGKAIRETIYPIIDFIRNVDWAGAAQKISEIFDAISKVAAGGAIAAGIAVVIGGLEKIVGFIGAIGGLLGVGGVAGVAAGGGILGGLALMGALVAPIIEHAVAIDRATEAADRLNKTVKEQQQEFANNKAEIDAAGTVVGVYIDRLEELENQGLDTKEAQEEYQSILDQIVTIMPELSDAVEKANGQYIGFSATLRDNADAWIANATAQAYKSEIEAVAAEKAKADFEKAKNEAELEEVNKTLAVYDSLTAQADKYSEEYMSGDISTERWLELRDNILPKINEQLQALGADSSIQEALARRGELEAAIAEDTKKIARAQKELDKAKAAYEELSEQSGGFGENEEENQGTTRQDLTKLWIEQKKAAQDAGKGVGEGVKEGIDATSGEAVAAATDMANAVENAYRDELDVHSPSGVTEEIGEGVGEGLAKGMQSTIGEIQSAAAAAARAIGTGIISQSGFIQSQISRIVGMAREFVSGLMSSAAMSYHWGNGNWVDRNGNFHSGANGIPARAGGDSNFPGGKTLVNELGPELISENGRAYIAAGGKPAVVNLSPGAIVIPADQTREALKGGMPKYGRAQAMNVNQISGGGGASVNSVTNLSKRIDTYSYAGAVNAALDAIKKAAQSSGGKTTGGGGGGSSKSGGGGSSSSGPTKPDFDKLESALSDLLSKLEEQIKLAENEGDYPRVVELYEQAQESISDLVEKYRKAGYADDSIEILKLLNKNYDYANKQLDVYHDKWDELIDALSADTDATKAAKELEEKRLALEEAQAAYENAQKQRTVRMYNAATGQWEWIADDKKIQSARDAVTSAEDSYTDAVKSQAIAELEKMKDTVSDLSDVVLGPALSTVVTMAETTEEFQNFARALNAVFGVGSFLQSTEGSTKVQPTVDSHDTNYTFGGVDISPEQASNMSLKELAQMLQVLKIT